MSIERLAGLLTKPEFRTKLGSSEKRNGCAGSA
jgi:hypothetical protein